MPLTPPMPPTLRERCAGSLIGLACGDAVGTTVEFQSRGTFPPVTDMIGGGPFGLAPGQWTDDTSMALCLAKSLLEVGGFDPFDQMNRYLDWWRRGYLSSTGECFDIGMTVRAALVRFESTRDPFAGSVDPETAGNGALMRLAPIVLFYYPDFERIQRFAVDSSRTTHAAPEALDCSRLMAHVIAAALADSSKSEMLDGTSLRLASPRVASLAAALWCFHTTDSFESAVLRAVNLGDDADTTAAIVGQIAGAYYGLNAIPAAWRSRLYWGGEIEQVAYRLAAAHGND